jgi:hypothetical protein
MTGNDVLTLVRYALNDMSDSKTSSYDKMNAINAGNRFVRKLAYDYKPSILNYTETGNTVASTTEYTLTHKPNKILSVRLDGQLVPVVNKYHIRDLTQIGKPTGYYVSAFDKVSFWPVPDGAYSFSVDMTEASSDWAENTTVPWTSDMVDIIIAYAVGLLQGTLDANSLKSQTMKLLTGLEPESVGVSSYWCVRTESDY